MLSVYPIIIILLCDIAVITASMVWFEHGGARAYNPIRAWQPYLVRMAVYCVFAYFFINGGDEASIISTVGWYILVITAVCHAFYAILQAVNIQDPSWLIGTTGNVGLPNWISITRIALSLLVPHIYAAQPFGEVSCTVGTIVLTVAMVSDAVDGFFARKLHAFTKAGKALDPLGDKVIFYPVVIAYLIASNGTAYLAHDYRILFFVALGIMALRDVSFIVWFALYYHKLPDGIGACLLDKIRMVVMCIFLGLIALTMTLPAIRDTLAQAAFIAIACIAVLSVVNIIVNYNRVMPILREAEIIRKNPDE